MPQTNEFDDFDAGEYAALQRDLNASARDWEIIRNKYFGTNERIWSSDSDYSVDSDRKL